MGTLNDFLSTDDNVDEMTKISMGYLMVEDRCYQCDLEDANMKPCLNRGPFLEDNKHFRLLYCQYYFLSHLGRCTLSKELSRSCSLLDMGNTV